MAMAMPLTMAMAMAMAIVKGIAIAIASAPASRCAPSPTTPAGNVRSDDRTARRPLRVVPAAHEPVGVSEGRAQLRDR